MELFGSGETSSDCSVYRIRVSRHLWCSIAAWFLGTAMDKDHLYVNSVVLFVVFETGRFFSFAFKHDSSSLWNWLVSSRSFVFFLSSTRSSLMSTGLHFLSCLHMLWKNCDSLFTIAIISLNLLSSISKLFHQMSEAFTVENGSSFKIEDFLSFWVLVNVLIRSASLLFSVLLFPLSVSRWFAWLDWNWNLWWWLIRSSWFCKFRA